MENKHTKAIEKDLSQSQRPQQHNCVDSHFLRSLQGIYKPIFPITLYMVHKSESYLSFIVFLENDDIKLSTIWLAEEKPLSITPNFYLALN